MTKVRVLCRWQYAVAIVLLSHSVVWAHPFYASLAEMEWNAQTGRLEVAVQLDPDDLENALRTVTGRHVVLEREANLDKVLAAYVADTFHVVPRTRQPGPRRPPGKIHWVGHEFVSGFVWIYFEVELDAGVTALDVSQTMLIEVAPLQVNTVTLKEGKRYRSIRCTANRQEQTIVLSRPLWHVEETGQQRGRISAASSSVAGVRGAARKEPAER